VRNLLERLGSPEEIVAEAADPPPLPSAPVSAPETNSSAVASVVLGALWLLGIGSVLALIFGYRAHREIKSSQPNQTGAGLATAGIVLGWVGIAVIGLVAGSPSHVPVR
jgi:cytochrome c biogenesis factor